MDNLTHSLVGLVASKAGLERLSPATTPLCILAANAPDSDILALIFGDRWTFLEHHRGITHSVVGTLALSLLLPMLFYVVDLGISRFRHRPVSVRFGRLLLASLIVGATHPLMDWTNNYGIRPLLPFKPDWYYGDFVFIVDPFIWLLLGGASFLVTSRSKKQLAFWVVLAMIVTFVVMTGARGRGLTADLRVVQVIWVGVLALLAIASRLDFGARWGERIPIAAIAMLVLYWSFLYGLHSVALSQARTQAQTIARQREERLLDVAAMPNLANPFQWQSVLETDRAAYRLDISLWPRVKVSAPEVRYETVAANSDSQAMTAAMDDRRAQIFLGFARFPIARVLGSDCASQTLVQLADLRYTEPGSQRGTFALEIPVECPENSLRTNR